MIKATAEKQWTRPELIRLGSIADVAGLPGLVTEGAIINRS